MLRRLHLEQPDSFAFTPANQAWAEAQITKYPEGRQASAIIPLLWRAHEQEGWLTRPAIEHVAKMLDMAYIRALEVATFYFMFKLQPTGSVAHIQVCGTTSCMICGAEDLIAVCREKIAEQDLELSPDGKFTWEEVECIGACSNAPVVQIGKDYYEDLTAERLAWIIDELAAGRVPTPGPQNGRYASEPASGLTSLTGYYEDRLPQNASVALATEIGDTVKRIDGTEVPLIAPWEGSGVEKQSPPPPRPPEESPPPPRAGQTGVLEPQPSAERPASPTGVTKQAADAASRAKPVSKANPQGEAKGAVQDRPERAPQTLEAPRGGQADDLTRLRGIGPQLAGRLNDLGIYHYTQIASWGPEEIEWVENRLRSNGRIQRDDWVGQAQALTGGK